MSLYDLTPAIDLPDIAFAVLDDSQGRGSPCLRSRRITARVLEDHPFSSHRETGEDEAALREAMSGIWRNRLPSDN